MGDTPDIRDHPEPVPSPDDGQPRPAASSGGDAWGRVAEDGTVYVRTAAGERAVGSWAAGSPEEALSYFHRKYEGLRVEVELLERRINETDLPVKDALGAIEKLRHTVAEAHAVGDLDALDNRLTELTKVIDERRAARRAAREQHQLRAREIKERIVTEAEELADSTEWRAAGERLRGLVDEWKGAARLDKKADDELWHRFSQARSAFSKRRKAHFSQLDAERDAAKARKEKLVAMAEELRDSTDWSATATRFRELMREWRAAGRAHREVDDELWSRFRTAQDAFFGARNSAFAAADEKLQANLVVKQQLLAEAQRLVPVGDVRAARASLRSIHERWEAAGSVPREDRSRVEGALRAVERAVQEAEDAEWQRTNPEARARAEDTVRKLRASIATLESQAEQFRGAGDQRRLADAEAALTARREWLSEAEKALAEFTR